MSWERGTIKCERKSPAYTKVSEEGGEEVLQVLEQRFPCSPITVPPAQDRERKYDKKRMG